MQDNIPVFLMIPFDLHTQKVKSSIIVIIGGIIDGNMSCTKEYIYKF